MAMRGRAQSNAELRDDGCVSTIRAAQIAGIKPATLRHWLRTQLLEATRHSEGRGVFARFDLTDIHAAWAVAQLRKQGVSLQACRLVQAKLRAMDKDFANARLLGFNRGNRRTDVLIAETPEEGRGILKSLLEVPGQVVIADIALSGVSAKLRRRFDTALQLPAVKRGRPLGAKDKVRRAPTSTAAFTSRAAEVKEAHM